MSFPSICNHLDKLNALDKFINYKYEPHAIKCGKDWKRHIYFKDFKHDFIKELTTYGFSPFVHQPYRVQRQNQHITKYKLIHFNYGYINYVHKKNYNRFTVKGIQGSDDDEDDEKEENELKKIALSTNYQYKRVLATKEVNNKNNNNALIRGLNSSSSSLCDGMRKIFAYKDKHVNKSYECNKDESVFRVVDYMKRAKEVMNKCNNNNNRSDVVRYKKNKYRKIKSALIKTNNRSMEVHKKKSNQISVFSTNRVISAISSCSQNNNNNVYDSVEKSADNIFKKATGIRNTLFNIKQPSIDNGNNNNNNNSNNNIHRNKRKTKSTLIIPNKSHIPKHSSSAKLHNISSHTLKPSYNIKTIL